MVWSELTSIKVEIAKLKTKAGMWGAVGGAVGGSIIGVVLGIIVPKIFGI